VPLRAAACHCGTTRARAEELQAAAAPPVVAAPRVARGPSDRREALNAMTTDVKLLLAVSALVLVAGLGWLAFAPPREPYPAVLGYVDSGPPKLPAPPRPPFKLPWWK
jgi:hypothetical protein